MKKVCPECSCTRNCGRMDCAFDRDEPEVLTMEMVRNVRKELDELDRPEASTEVIGFRALRRPPESEPGKRLRGAQVHRIVLDDPEHESETETRKYIEEFWGHLERYRKL